MKNTATTTARETAKLTTDAKKELRKVAKQGLTVDQLIGYVAINFPSLEAESFLSFATALYNDQAEKEWLRSAASYCTSAQSAYISR